MSLSIKDAIVSEMRVKQIDVTDVSKRSVATTDIDDSITLRKGNSSNLVSSINEASSTSIKPIEDSSFSKSVDAALSTSTKPIEDRSVSKSIDVALSSSLKSRLDTDLTLDNNVECNNFEDVERGGAYGDEFDVHWMVGFKGVNLLKVAEKIILESMHRRDTVDQTVYWKSVLPKISSWNGSEICDYNDDTDNNNNETRFISIKSLGEIWSSQYSKLSGSVIAALCVRFSDIYSELQNELYLIQESKSSDNVKKDRTKRLLQDFTIHKFQSKIVIDCLIDVHELLAFVSKKEMEMEVIEVQVSRAEYILEPLSNEKISTELILGLFARLGLPGAGEELYGALIRSAMMCEGLDADIECTIGIILSYCIARVASGKHYMFPIIFTIVNPNCNNSGDEENENQNGNIGKDNRLIKPIKHILSLFSSLNQISDGKVATSSLASAITLNYQLLLSNDQINTMCHLWSRGINRTFTHYGDLEIFFCPYGYNLTVKTQMGSYRLLGKVKPCDTLSAVYGLISKNLFFKLTQQHCSDRNLRVPSDLQLFSDSTLRNFIPNSNDLIIQSFSSDSKVYVHSKYVLDLVKEQVENVNDDQLRKQKSRSRGKKEVIKVAKPMTSAPPKDATEALDRLLVIGPPISMPPAPPFYADEAEAHRWNLPTVKAYVTNELGTLKISRFFHIYLIFLLYLELDIYMEAFENHEVSGYELICLDQERIVKTLNILHPIHCTKIAMHTNILRDKVFKKASISCPKSLKDWDYEHVAGWLRFNLACPKCALLALRKKLDGVMLTEMLIEEITDILGGDGDIESAKATLAIRNLIEQDMKQNSLSPRPVIPSLTVPKSKKNISKETAIKKRRKSKDARENKSENALMPPEVGNIIQVDVNGTTSSTGNDESIRNESKKVVPVMVQDPSEPIIPKLILPQNQAGNEKNDIAVDTIQLNQSVECTVQRAEVDAIILSSRPDKKHISPRNIIDDTPNHIKDAIQPIALPDISFNNKFADKIFELQKVIETQAVSFAEIQKETERLREDKRIANQRLELVAKENKQARDAIKVLEKDRKNIEKMLVDVTTKVNDLDADKSKLAKQVKKIEEEVANPPEVIKEKVYLSCASSVDNAMDYIGLNGRSGKNSRGGNNFESLSLREIMEDAASNEIKLFEHLSRKYVIEHDSDFGVSETRTILQRIASLWMRLGHRIYEDSKNQTEFMTNEEFITLNDIKKCIKTLYLADNANALPNNSLTMDEINEHCQQPYIIAAGFVFLIGIIRRIFDRYGSIKDNKDRSQIMSLFTQMRQGEIRNFTELSRENFRLFSEDTLGLSFQNNWDKLDAVCQRLDPDKKGFIKFTALIHAFRVITPIIDLLPNSITVDQRIHDRSLTAKRHEVLFNAQNIILFILSLSTEFIIASAISSSSILASTTSLGSVATTDTSPRKSLSIHEIITQMISTRIESTPSFKSFLSNTDDEKPKSKGDSRLVHLLQLIGDIIYELIRPFITVRSKSKEYYEGLKKNLGVQSNSKNFFLTFIASHCRECTIAVAKALQIYDSFDPSTAIMEFSSLYLTFFLYRRSCLIALLDNVLPVDMDRPYSKINKKSIKSTIAVIESVIVSFIGDEDAKIMFSSGNINGMEKCVSELLGFFIPTPGILSFSSCQCDIEYYMLQIQEIKAKNNNNDNSLLNTLIRVSDTTAMASKDSIGTVAYTSILKEIHNNLNDTDKINNTKIAFNDDKENISHGANAKQIITSPSKKKMKKKINSIVIQEVNKVLTSQRLNQLTSYLDYLNNKAYSKKQILQVLVNLWYSTSTITSADKESYLKCIKTHEDLGNSLVLNKNEILKRTTDMQKSLLASMQEVPTAKIAALANRVEMLKEAVLNKSIEDDDFALQEVLENIDVLEKSLLTANTDAMALATNIVNKLKCIV